MRVEGKFVNPVNMLAASVALAALSAGAAQAQPSSEPGLASQPTADSDGLDDIVVTAQRRAESAQDVPISLQSFSADMLSERAVSSTEDLTTVVSGLIVAPSGARPALYLRGVGNNSANTTPSVLTFIDGVYQPFGFSTDLENVERIEVLKGPQGTLFGRNATGGVIQIITRPPSETFGARAEVGYGNFDTIDASAYLTGGLAPGIAMDLAVRYHDQNDGFGTNIARNEDAYYVKRHSVRARVRAEISDQTSLTLVGDFARVEQTQGSAFPPAFGYGFLFIDGAKREFGGSYFPDKYDINSGATRPFTRTKEWGVAGTFETDLGGLTFRSITAYRHGSERANIDSDGGPSTALHIHINRTPRTSFTQELQLLSNSDGPFDWTAGAFYYRGKLASAPFGFFGTTAQILFGIVPGGIITANAVDIADSIAAYAQGTYRITPTTRLTVGGRYTSEKRSTKGTVSRDGVLLPARSGELSLKINEPTWRVSLEQDLTRDVMVYASVSRAFNSGYFNSASVGGFASEAVNPRVNPEFLTAYEVGAKADLLDRRLRVNFSAFKYDYKDLQQQVLEFGVTKTINAGAAKIKGVELEVTARPVRSLTLSFSGTYLDANYASYLLAPNYVLNPNGSITTGSATQPTTKDAAGNKIINTPKTNYSISAVHTLQTSIGEFTTAANLNYRGKAYVDAQNYFKLPTRYVLDITEKWTSNNEKLFISAWVKNLFDKQYDYAVAIVAPAGLVGLHAPPRTYGMSAGFQF